MGGDGSKPAQSDQAPEPLGTNASIKLPKSETPKVKLPVLTWNGYLKKGTACEIRESILISRGDGNFENFEDRIFLIRARDVPQDNVSIYKTRLKNYQDTLIEDQIEKHAIIDRLLETLNAGRLSDFHEIAIDMTKEPITDGRRPHSKNFTDYTPLRILIFKGDDMSGFQFWAREEGVAAVGQLDDFIRLPKPLTFLDSAAENRTADSSNTEESKKNENHSSADDRSPDEEKQPNSGANDQDLSRTDVTAVSSANSPHARPRRSHSRQSSEKLIKRLQKSKKKFGNYGYCQRPRRIPNSF